MALACGGDDDHLMPKVPEERSRKSFYPQFEVEGACDRKAAVTFNRRSKPLAPQKDPQMLLRTGGRSGCLYLGSEPGGRGVGGWGAA
jgi:hypothetical protein